MPTPETIDSLRAQVSALELVNTELAAKMGKMSAELAKAEAACAEMRALLERIRTGGWEYLEGSEIWHDVDKALSADCGKGWVPPEIFAKLGAVVAALGTRADDAEKKVRILREALDNLMSWQNGPPLVAWTEQWNAAMRQAQEALNQAKP